MFYIFIITDRRLFIAAWIRLLEWCLSRRMSVTESCDADKISSLVKFHVPKVKLRQQLEAELTFMLPFENMGMLPGQTFVSLCPLQGWAEDSE